MTTRILFFSLGLLACGDKDDTGDTGQEHDGGSEDGGAGDGGTEDGGSSDGGSSDGGSSDGGSSDGGSSDGGTADGGAGDGGSGDGGASEDIELLGSWVDNWGSDHQITNETWTSYGGSAVFHIASYDNDLDFAIARNDSANEYSPDLWSRFDWHIDAKLDTWFCQTAYDAPTANAALSTPAADSSDLANGCSGFSWSQLTPAR